MLPAPIATNDRIGSKLSQWVYESLLGAILSGDLAPGDVVSEVELAKRLEVSRTPVREAVGALVKDGLIVHRANRRPIIARFSKHDVRDIFEMRQLLEGEAAYLAADRIARSELGRLRAVAENLQATRDDPQWLRRWADFDSDFHLTIAAAGDRPRLCDDIARYRLLHHAFNTLRTRIDVLDQALQEHIGILDALEDRNAQEARRRMIEHIREWQAFFMASVDG